MSVIALLSISNVLEKEKSNTCLLTNLLEDLFSLHDAVEVQKLLLLTIMVTMCPNFLSPTLQHEKNKTPPPSPSKKKPPKKLQLMFLHVITGFLMNFYTLLIYCKWNIYFQEIL